MSTQHPRTGEPAAERPPVRDRGVTFVEIIVTIVLLGVVVIPFLGAVRSSIRASMTTDSAADVETLLVNAVDRVNRAELDDCDFESEVDAAVETFGWPDTAASTSVEYMDSAGNWSGTPSAPCGTQVLRVTVTVRDPDTGVQRTLQVVKSDF